MHLITFWLICGVAVIVERTVYLVGGSMNKDVFLATMQLGYITPPVGLNLFIAGYRFDKPIVSIYLSTLPFFAFLLIAVALIAFWPALSLVLL